MMVSEGLPAMLLIPEDQSLKVCNPTSVEFRISSNVEFYVDQRKGNENK